MSAPTPNPARIPEVDIARTVALGGMVLFHFVYDLELFGHLPPGTTALPGGWAWFARLVAGSFLFLAGASLVLGHGQGIRWPAFLRRLAVLGGAAALVSLGTWFAVPQAWVFFGILHAIAAFSVIGLAALRLPAWATAALAAAILVAGPHLRHPAFDTPWLWWTGLSTLRPVSIDFEPLFPWLAPFLFGMAVARAGVRAGLAARAARPPSALARRLAWPGRYSLAIYLIHQPVLIGLVWLGTALLA